jgi:hypothetical protein
MQGDAVRDIGVAAVVVEQLRIEGYLKRTLLDDDEQDIDLAFNKVSFGAA